MHKSILVISCIIAIVALGCASNDKASVSGVKSNDAAELNAKRNAFETSEDPPINAQTRFAAGQLAESQGAIPAAIKQYVEAVKFDPQHQPSWYRLGVLYTQTRQFPKAIEAWDQYVRITRGDAVAYSNLGFAHELSGDRTSAEAAYRKGIARDPANKPCRVNYGLMLARAGRDSEALQQLQAVLSPAEAQYNLGSVYEQIGKKQQAEAAYRAALEMDPNMWQAQQRLADLK